MPIEIREVVIRARVQDAQSTSDPAKASAVQSSDLEALIQECVQQVLQILEDKKAR